jgi:futalosine hydrolase
VILLACAVAKELTFWKPRRGVELVVTGVGPVESACAVAAALERRRYDVAIAAGLGGAIGDAAAVGDGVAVVDDTLELGLEDGRPIALPAGDRVVDRALSDDELVSALTRRGYRALRGVTVVRVTSTEATASRLSSLGFGVESMEGFAVLRAAQLAGVTAVQVRGISNRVGARERSGWSFEAGVRGLQGILDALLAVLDTAGAGAVS